MGLILEIGHFLKGIITVPNDLAETFFFFLFKYIPRYLVFEGRFQKV